MRFVKPLLSVVLAISILLNIVLIYKVRGKRALIVVNGTPIARADMQAFLEQQYGPQYKANLVSRLLIDKEAKDQSVAPADDEVQAEFDSRKELDWSYAQKMAKSPWMVDEAKKDLKTALEMDRLLTKDIQVTEEEVREEYKQNPQLYDTPNKARCSVAAVLNDLRTEEVKKLLLARNPPMEPHAIAENFPREVYFLGEGGHYTFMQPLGSQDNDPIFKMEPKSVRVDPPRELAQLGAKKLVIRLEEILQGHKADLNDPKTINQIKLHIAMKRAKPQSEELMALWQKANIVFDDPADKAAIELILFPERSSNKSR